MHRSAACQELIADSVMAEAEFEEPNLFTLRREDGPDLPADTGPDAGPGSLSSLMPAVNKRPGLILVHDDDDASNELTPEKVPNTSVILREGWPWVDETAEAVDILLEGVDFSDVCSAAGTVARRPKELAVPVIGDSIFPRDDHSATQDIIQCHPAAGGHTMNDASTDERDVTPVPPKSPSENAPHPSIVAQPEMDHDLGEMASLGDESTLGEPVLSDADLAAMRKEIADRQPTASAPCLSPDKASDRPTDLGTPDREAKMRPLPTLPSPGSIAKLGEPKTGTAPKRIGSGRLVPTRLTWRPGDPFAGSVDKPTKRRFRWEVMLTAASITAASGMGCAWLLRAVFA